MHDKPIFGIKPDTLYKANPRDLTCWAHKINHNRPYDQAYGQFIRVIVHDDEPSEHEGEAWMVDTYHLNRLSWSFGANTKTTIEKLLEMRTMHFTSLQHVRFDCYYNDCVKLTEENAHLFEELCDLNDFTSLMPGQNPEHYSPNDIVRGVHLFREHGFSWDYGDIGITLIRKNAEPDWKRKMSTLSRSVKSQIARNVYPYDMKELEILALEHKDDDFALSLLEQTREEYEMSLHIEAIKEERRPRNSHKQLQIPGLEDKEENE
jgi:hypothetical protein